MNYKYRKKPVVIEAFQITQKTRQDNSNWPEWLNRAWNRNDGDAGRLYPSEYPNSDGTDLLCIETLEGTHTVSWGDYIIQGVAGEIYPCKPEIFEATYVSA